MKTTKFEVIRDGLKLSTHKQIDAARRAAKFAHGAAWVYAKTAYGYVTVDETEDWKWDSKIQLKAGN
jgi:hypothetical protein